MATTNTRTAAKVSAFNRYFDGIVATVYAILCIGVLAFTFFFAVGCASLPTKTMVGLVEAEMKKIEEMKKNGVVKFVYTDKKTGETYTLGEMTLENGEFKMGDMNGTK